MTFGSLFTDWTMVSLFLIIGYLLRRFVPLFRKIYLPASVIGGFVALLGGPQIGKVWKVPASFASYSGILIILIMTCLVWGVTINKSKVRSYVDYMFVLNAVRFGQIGLGAILGIALRRVWTGLPQGWGTMGVASFFGGHGTAGAYGATFESLGVQGNTGIGMIMSTIGLIVAVTIGMVFVNIGVRKGWATFVRPGSEAKADSGDEELIPSPKRRPIGLGRVSSESINNLAFQFGMLMTVIWFGRWLLAFLGKHVWSVFGTLPNFTAGIVGALIIWPVLSRLGLGDYVDKATVSNISGFALEVLIVGSVATLDIALVTEFWVPILIYSVIVVAFTAWVCFWYCPRVCEKEWFEKGLFMFGQGTGNTPTGLALVRAVDPESVATPGEAHGVSSGFTTPILFWVPALTPVLAVKSPISEVLMGVGVTLGCVIVGWVLFRKKIADLRPIPTRIGE